MSVALDNAVILYLTSELTAVKQNYSLWLGFAKPMMKARKLDSISSFASDLEDSLERLIDDIKDQLTGEEVNPHTRDYITHYSVREGEDWLLWPIVLDSIPSDEVLSEATRNAVSNIIIISNVPFFSFKTKNGRSWDVKNGWRHNIIGREATLIQVDEPYTQQEVTAVSEVTKAAEFVMDLTQPTKIVKRCTCDRWPTGDCDNACMSS